MSRIHSKAVVLGGGGPVGRAWQAGFLTGLISNEVAVEEAKLVVGTSAGAIVGALLTTGADLEPVGEPALRMGQLVPGLAPSRDTKVRADFGQAALSAEAMSGAMSGAMSEAESLSRVTLAPLAQRDWPIEFAATAVNALTGEFRVFRAGDRVPLQSAVAASAALPGVYPAITVQGQRYVDGGLRSMLNADQAAGHDALLILSCFPLDAADQADLAVLRKTGTIVQTVSLADRLQGTNMLDQTFVGPAYAIGMEHAQAEVDALGVVWSA